MAPEARPELLAEYKAIEHQQTSAINLRFVTLGAFAALNGFLLTGYGYILTNPTAFSRVLLGILALGIGGVNLVLLRIEQRTASAIGQTRRIGADVAEQLQIPNSVYRQMLAAREEMRYTHERILTKLYTFVMIGGLVGGVVIAALWSAPPKPKEELAEIMRTLVPAVIEAQMEKIGAKITDELKREIQALNARQEAREARIEQALRKFGERVMRLERTVKQRK